MAYKPKNLRLTVVLWGLVQGVGFRPFVLKIASLYGVFGVVSNRGGSVYIEAEGTQENLDFFLLKLQNSSPKNSYIAKIHYTFSNIHDNKYINFIIDNSDSFESGPVFIPPDFSICDDCTNELFDENNSRNLHPFISCALCGPRYSIIKKMPYDRCNTSMKDFEMCSYCSKEYSDASDRRSHAQTISCKTCGPRISYYSKDNHTRLFDSFALSACNHALMNNNIVAIKGIGGYHLACSPFSDEAVNNLRLLKGREEKPFAVMFPSLDVLKEYAFVTPYEEKWLLATEKPIILLDRKPSSLSRLTYQNSRLIGAFLPYTPLQHLILSKVGPLIMTSCNFSESPIINGDMEMLNLFEQEKLLFAVLTHDRNIVHKSDDSIIQCINEMPQIFRRARGFAPLPISVTQTSGNEVLALGSQQKNTFCLAKNGFFYPSTHIGDLDDAETFNIYEQSIKNNELLLNISREIVCYDMHPNYATTRLAIESGTHLLPVQHHHAHIASVMAENNITNSVIGVAFDGTGYGTDGTVWGGEFLIADVYDFKRVANLKPISYIGGDSSIFDAAKTASCLLFSIGLENEINDPRRDTIEKALGSQINTVLSSSMGRVFDAVSSLLGICHLAAFEGDPAIRLENIAADYHSDVVYASIPYSFNLLDKFDTTEIDLSPCISSILSDLHNGIANSPIAYKFHKTISEMTAQTCITIRNKTNLSIVALSGGVFQNRILLKLTTEALRNSGFDVYTNHIVPPNDGGISLGQAYIGYFNKMKRGV